MNIRLDSLSPIHNLQVINETNIKKSLFQSFSSLIALLFSVC